MGVSYYCIADLRQLIVKSLAAHNTEMENARSTAEALLSAEIDGLRGHGLSRLPFYCAQARSGKVNGNAIPVVQEVATAAVRIDAGYGFAYPALDLAVNKLIEIAMRAGIAVAAVTNSHHCGAAGYHVEKIAQRGLIGLLFANTPKAIAPWGGHAAVFGTNPIAFAVPREDAPSLVIDLALSKVARGKIMMAKRENKTIPEGWALDAAGKITSDPNLALSGTMLPMGGAKGAALVLMVEILAAALTGSNLGFEASSFFEDEGAPPRVGQLLLAFAPQPISGGSFHARIESLCAAILGQNNTRLPGDRRLLLRKKAYQEGVPLSCEQYIKLQKLANI